MLGSAIQSASSLKLWVALIGPFMLDIPSLEEASLYINEALVSLQEMGADTEHVIAAGHGMGGHVAENWAVDWFGNARALIMMARQPDLVDPNLDHLPYLLISGDLDGIRVVTGVWEDYKRLESSLWLQPDNMFTRPVIVLEDVNHQHFSSGTPSSIMLDRDILSPIGYDEAHRTIATHVSAFLSVAVEENSDSVEAAKEVLEEAYVNTGAIFKALSEMSALTGGAGRSEWSEESQRIIVALMDAYQDTLIVEDKAWFDESGLVGGFPLLNLTDDGRANITTLTYINQPFQSIGNHTVLELAVKLKSQEAVKELLGPLDVEFGEPTTCKDINQVALDIAIAAASRQVQDRFVSRGHPVTLLADDVKLTGPGWYTASLYYNLTKEGLYIQSPSLPTNVNVGLGLGGMHYCWLLPPLRALEYVLVDALRHTNP
ncbi:unnamed protein product [Meganyctiphanes norvegica]|uniref:Uncharacterized protein n=1 Tax=Meganyctiphanes norvegica TaxID=48144 RepID=A0AAV2PVW7_MEGNR